MLPFTTNNLSEKRKNKPKPLFQFFRKSKEPCPVDTKPRDERQFVPPPKTHTGLDPYAPPPLQRKVTGHRVPPSVPKSHPPSHNRTRSRSMNEQRSYNSLQSRTLAAREEALNKLCGLGPSPPPSPTGFYTSVLIPTSPHRSRMPVSPVYPSPPQPHTPVSRSPVMSHSNSLRKFSSAQDLKRKGTIQHMDYSNNAAPRRFARGPREHGANGASLARTVVTRHTKVRPSTPPTPRQIEDEVDESDLVPLATLSRQSNRSGPRQLSLGETYKNKSAPLAMYSSDEEGDDDDDDDNDDDDEKDFVCLAETMQSLACH